MEFYDDVLKLIDVNLVYCLAPMVLTLAIINSFFNNRFATKKALNLIRWFVIGYSVNTVVLYIITFTTSTESFEFLNRATGFYKIAYLLVLFSATILPFTLLFKKLGSNFIYVLVVSILIKIGVYFEKFVIVVTSFHRDYVPPDKLYPSWLDFSIYEISLVWAQGFILAILTLGAFEVVNRVKFLSFEN